MATAEDEEPDVIFVGDEDLNEEAEAYIDRTLRDDETLVAVASFDFETKVLVITDQRVLIIGETGDSHDRKGTITWGAASLIAETSQRGNGNGNCRGRRTRRYLRR